MYSLNVPVPGRVSRIASELHPHLADFDAIRERHTLLVKRLGDAPPGGVDRLEGRVRAAVAGTPPFEIRIPGIDYFGDPARGSGPVVYLAVESPGLVALHERLVDAFDPVEDIEGRNYTPHVTLARGGDLETARRLAARDVDPVSWTATRLQFWDATYEESVSTIALPA